MKLSLYPKTINRLIRTLLNIFDKRVYIGYTATPFANIFIHNQAKTNEEGLDLFPKDYIIDLPIPSNHVGLEKIFNIEKFYILSLFNKDNLDNKETKFYKF